MLNEYESKEKLREALLEQRESIPEPQYYGASADIVERLKEVAEYQNATTVHCYVSMNKRREVETRELIREMLDKDKDVIVPITNVEDGTLKNVRLHSFDELEENQWGVLEPANGEEVSGDKFDLVIVPMVGGDEQGNRIGYGKGFYDRFLQDVGCIKIGLLFEDNVVKEIPTEKFDIPMDKIVTENRIIDT